MALCTWASRRCVQAKEEEALKKGAGTDKLGRVLGDGVCAQAKEEEASRPINEAKREELAKFPLDPLLEHFAR